jgi:hypothetical protein
LLILVNILVLAVIAAGVWWLTGMDKTWGGESKRGHHLTRALRSIGVVLLAAALITVIESPASPGAIPLLLIAPAGIGLLLRSPISEVFTHGFMRVLDPAMHDHREFDPRKAERCQDAIAHLIRTGRRQEAIKMCEAFKESGEVDLATLELTLEFLGVEQGGRKRANPLAEAASLRLQQKFPEAEALLLSLLDKKPDDEGAAIMLMRLYAGDLQQPERAYKVLRAFEQQPHVSRGPMEFARRSILEWTAAGRGGTGVAPGAADATAPDAGRPVPASDPPQSPQPATAVPLDLAEVDRLLAEGSLGSAVAMLEREVKARPLGWALQLKLAEVYAVHCKDLVRAEKLVQRLEHQPGFGTEQTAFARAKLDEWRLRP